MVIDGAGTLGRRIAAVYSGGGSDVRIFDLSAEQDEKELSLGSTSLSEAELALPLGIAPEKSIDFVSTPGMDDTDWGTA